MSHPIPGVLDPRISFPLLSKSWCAGRHENYSLPANVFLPALGSVVVSICTKSETWAAPSGDSGHMHLNYPVRSSYPQQAHMPNSDVSIMPPAQEFDLSQEGAFSRED